MIGLGTIINSAAIIVGGLFGLLLGNRISARFRETLTQGASLCTLFIGISGAIEGMLTFDGNSLVSTDQSLMMIISFCLGGLVGELLNLEKHIEDFGNFLKFKSKSEGDSRFIDGFVTTSLTVCIGAMAVVGSIEDGIYGDYSILTVKALLDMIFLFIITASLGKGCIFSAIPVFIFQGSITLLSKVIEPVMTEKALANLSLTGSVLIFCVGVNLIWGKKIKVANLLPTIVFAVIFSFLF